MPNSNDAGAKVMRQCYAKAASNLCYDGNGEGGIRTLGTLLGYGALAKRCFRPLSHLTKIVGGHRPPLQENSVGREYGGESLNANIGNVDC
jgi:hypothetical protein